MKKSEREQREREQRERGIVYIHMFYCSKQVI